MLKRVFLLVSLLIVSVSLSANDVAWQALKEGKAIVLMRHAYAPDTNEVSFFEPEQCAGERNLSASGREQGKKVAAVFRENGIEQATVFSSSLCRCMDTGKVFGFGSVENLPEINSYFADRSKGPAQVIALKNWIRAAIANPSTPVVLVTHGLNVTDLMETYAEQGEVLIVGVRNNQLSTLHRFYIPAE